MIVFKAGRKARLFLRLTSQGLVFKDPVLFGKYVGRTSQDFFASSLRSLRLCVRFRNFHAKLAKDAKKDAKKNVPEVVGEPRPRFAGDSNGIGFPPRVVSVNPMSLLRAGFCNMPPENARPRVVRPKNIAASCQPTASSSNRPRKQNGSSAVPSKRGLSVYIAPSPNRLVISVAQTLSTKANLLSSSKDGSLNSSGRREAAGRCGRFMYISPT